MIHRKLVQFARYNHHTLYWPAIPKNPVVVDLGGNRGGFSRAISKFYNVRGVIVEPVPDLYNALIAPNGMETRNVAVADKDGSVRISISSQEDCHRIGVPLDGITLGTIEVQSVSLMTLLQEHDISTVDVLKIDIEGSELEVLNSLPDDLLVKVSQATIEFHSAFGAYPESMVDNFVARMHRLNFYCFDFLGGRYADCLFINRRRCNLGPFHRAFLRHVSQRLMWRLPYVPNT
ncbi:FkbM family methyltransferase [Blastopirellula marina]|uniref:Methyltransferase FkbM domain-containing protein n=1 Tax=Blastopirellula marina TaxID=124 RepID=A0A2S8GNG3_9BACT|nr:FkbM family methyltransferase [Blastopirellula marina]PQO45967.1 hypothetical protein C5Y93_12000 [Blastopirellula marina]